MTHYSTKMTLQQVLSAFDPFYHLAAGGKQSGGTGTVSLAEWCKVFDQKA